VILKFVLKIEVPFTFRTPQVWWTMMDPVPLPDDIVKRFDNGMLPIIGYEVDQVRSFFPFKLLFSLMNADDGRLKR